MPSYHQSIVHYEPIGGWLLFLCIILTIVSPTTTTLIFISDYNSNPQLFLESSSDWPYLVVGALVLIILMGCSIFAGIRLWMRARKALLTAKIYLIVYLLYTIATGLLFILFGESMEGDPSLQTDGIKQIFRGAVFFAIWFPYLSFSERVKRTFPESFGIDQQFHDLVDQIHFIGEEDAPTIVEY